METKFSLINSEAQAKITAGQQDGKKSCHSCGSSELYPIGSHDEWGYNLYRCQRCGDICEFWDEN